MSQLARTIRLPETRYGCIIVGRNWLAMGDLPQQLKRHLDVRIIAAGKT